MSYSIRSTFYSLIYLHLLILSVKALGSDALTAKRPREVSKLPQRFKPFPSSLTQRPRNVSNGDLQHMTGCFRPGTGGQQVSPQDALVTLGLAANVVAFFSPRHFDKSVVLASYNTAVIGLVRMGTGSDEFSYFDIMSQAISVIEHCIFQELPYSRLGGAIEVGSQNQFRVIVQAVRAPVEEILPEAG